MTAAVCGWVSQVSAEMIQGKVDESGKAIAGAIMVSVFDEDHRQWTSVFSRSEGTYSIDDLHASDTPRSGQELQAEQRGLAYAVIRAAAAAMNPTAPAERHVFTLIEPPALAPRPHD